jgi:alpha-tubulin suppressor-like RCC1 family protein
MQTIHVLEPDCRVARRIAVDDASMPRSYRLIVFCVASLSSVARAQTSEPVAAYAFSEGNGMTIADVSGNGNAGALTTGASWTTGGRFGNGLRLAGGIEGIKVAASPSLDIAAGLTMEAWICPASIAGYPKIVWRDGAEGSPFNLAMAFGNGTLVFSVLTTEGRFSAFAYSSLVAHVSTHVAATYDGTALRIYMDGALVGSAAAAGSIVPSAGDLWLGRAPWGEGFAGDYDEVRIYDRPLTAAEIVRDRDTQINGLDPPEAGSRSPAADSIGVAPSTVVGATFSKPIDAATLAGGNFSLSGPSGTVPATLAYDAGTRVATLTPTAPLARLTSYTVRITTSVGDRDEGTLRSPVTWTFTTSPDEALAHAAYAFSEGTGSTTADSSANGNTATLTRAVLWTATGKYGSGLMLAGGTDGARIPASPSSEPGSAVTLETWLYPTSIANYPKLIWRDGLDGSPYSLGLAFGDGSVDFGITTPAGRFSVVAYRSIVPDTWTHVAATYDGSALRIFVNGQLASVAAASGTIRASTRELWLGRAPWGEGFAGTLDDVRMYNRALTSVEIAIDMGTPASDVTPPNVVSTTPSSGRRLVDPSANVVAIFDRPLAEATVTASAFELRDSGGRLVPASVRYEASTQTVILVPIARLSDLATYTATLRTSIANRAGVPLQNEYSWTFTAGDATPPAITGITPATGARYVSLGSPVQIAFSEPLDPNSVTAGAIRVLDTRNVPVAGTVTYDAPTMTATFTPAASLLPTRTHTVTVMSGAFGVRDLAGNALAANYTSTFMTTVEPVRIAAGLYHSVAVDDTGQVWTWGGGSSQLGTSLDGRVPGRVTGASGIVSVAAGGSHTLALKADGTLLVWGDNSRGQLGTNSAAGSQPTPVALSGLSNVIAVAGGYFSSIALRSEGTVWTWGYWHQLGGGQTADSRVPVQVPGLTNVIAIASGDYADYALKADGTVWAWGENTFGQVGDGTSGTGLLRLTPTQVASLAGIVGIAGGDNHALAIVGSDLSIRAWGSNSGGQLGNGSSNPAVSTPVVTGLTDVRHIEGGASRSVSALLDGTVKTWGSAVTVTGGGSTVPITAPGNPVGVQVASGFGHGLAVDGAGTVWTWGTNTFGQLGEGTLTNRQAAAPIADGAYAWKVGRPEFTRVSGTYASAFTVTVTSATPGATIRYTTNGADPGDSDATVPVTGGVAINQSQTLKARAWKPGSAPSAVTSATYTLQVPQPSFSPGAGTYASPPAVTIASTAGAAIRYTTDGSTPSPSSPIYSGPVTLTTTSTLQAFATVAGWSSSPVAVASYTMNFGTLAAPVVSPLSGTYEGRVTVTLTAQPQSVIRYTTDGNPVLPNSPIYAQPLTVTQTTTVRTKAFRTDYTTSAESSATYTIVATPPSISLPGGTYAPGTLVTIADSDPTVTIRVSFTGADPTVTDGSIPSGATLLVGGFTLKARAFKAGTNSSAVASASYALTEPFGPGALAAGWSHTLAATPDGLLYAWGDGSSGQLGYGGTAGKRVPTVVPMLTGVTSIAAGAAHTLAATWDGRVFAWGSNGAFQLGDGAGANRPTPFQLSGLSGVIAVAAGNAHSLALTSDGHVYAWGTGPQLGLGTNLAPVPTLIAGLSNVVAIAAGASHSLAVTSRGELYAWGSNSSSQLGDGGFVPHNIPEPIAISDVVAAAAGGTHSLARVRSGAVYAWGDNSSGQLGLGDQTSRATPTLVPGLVALDIVAGGAHSLAIRTDGTALGWGAKNAGQLGDGTAGGVRTSPVAVSGLTSVALVAAGGTHSVAATLNGHVSTWGLNDAGQLGDGLNSNRSLPFEVFAAPGAWGSTPAPSLSVAPGTYNTAQVVVVINALGPAADIHYTTSGAAPTQTDPAIADGASLAIEGTTTLKLRAWVTGRAPSAVVTATYVLQPDVPLIAPGTATYASAQAVTVRGMDGALVRYTVDGTDPTAQSPVYAGALIVDTFTVLKAKAFRDGWTPSATATATFTFNYGTLAPPIAHPRGGTYASGQIVALEAASAAQIRFTLDGTDPDVASPTYVAPFQLPDGFVTLRARAFKIDWTESAAISESYTITDDRLPPTITASMSPPANVAGWNNTVVTVTFGCSDPSGVTVCTAPVRVGGEGDGIPVTGAATDAWGNHASTTWSVNIDRTPPVLHVYAPGESWNFPIETTSVTIRGGAAELSGLRSVSCNAVEATVTGNLFVCTVPVVAGTNDVTTRASDIAGNDASAAISFNVGDADITGLEISPGSMTMFAGDGREITVADQRGNEVHEGVWSVPDPSVASVSESDGVTIVDALAAGQTTLSVTFHGHTARATVTVFAAGGTLPAGTALWSLNDASGSAPPKRSEVLRVTAAAVEANPAKAPALMFVDEGTEWQANTLVRLYERPTRIRTTTVDGRQVSDVRFGGRIPQQVAADNDGGFVVVLPASGALPSTIQRFDARSGSISWEYVATSGYLSNVAIHPDGTLYASEGHVVGVNYLVSMTTDGKVSKSALPHGHYSQVDTGTCGLDREADGPGYVTGPIVLEDGSVALVSRVRAATQLIYSYPDESAPGGCRVQSHVQDYSYTDTSQLVQLTPSRAHKIHVLEDTTRLIPVQFYPEDYQLFPDGHGGLLLGRRKTPSAIRINANYQVVAANSTILPEDGSTRYETEYALGEDGAYALVNSVRLISLQPYAYAYESKVVQFDTETLQAISDADLGIPMTEPQHIRLKFALAGGGIYAVGPTVAYVVNPTVDTAGFAAGGNATHVANGLWSGWNGTGTPSAAPGGEVSIAQSWWASPEGLEAGNAVTPKLLTTVRLRELAKERGIGAGMTGIQFNRAVGLAFQGVAIWSLYQREDSNTFFLESPVRQRFTTGAVSNVVPDYLAPYVRGTTGPGTTVFPNSVLTEVKAVAGIMSLSYSRHQIRGLVDAAKLSPLGITNSQWPMVEFITTADTLIGLDTVEESTLRQVEIRQRLVLELAGGFLQVGPGRSLNGSWWTMFISGRTAVPGLLPGRTIAPLGSHVGESPTDDPDPPTVE